MTTASRRALVAVSALLCLSTAAARGQDADDLVVRPAPPALEDFETDQNGDGVPDGWYNLRDGKVVAEGGVVGPRFLRFEAPRAGRESRLSRAFGVDGKKYEALLVGLWVRIDQVQSGERFGQEPGLTIDFLGEKLRQTSRGLLGPWNVRTFHNYGGPRWVRVAKRIPVTENTLDAIMTLGLVGAPGILDVDGLTLHLVPRGGESTTNLVKNADFELGDPEPFGWSCENGARRAFPGSESSTALELASSSARAMTALARPVENLSTVDISVNSKGTGLRGSRGAAGTLFFLNDKGRETGVGVFSWSGSFDWREDRVRVPVPRGAVRAVLQFEKTDGIGSIKIDNVVVTAAPDPDSAAWTPYHVDDGSDAWPAVIPSTGIESGSALDFSFLQARPAGQTGRVAVRDGRFHYGGKGGRARFFGVQILPPAAFLEAGKADALADRLARSGINLVRLGDLDTPLGPGRSLIDDTLDDTRSFDQTALARLDHLIAALKSRGVHVAIELQGGRRFRSEDGIAAPGGLLPGGGPPAVFDSKLVKAATETAKALLGHVNPETGLALKNDPVLAWVTLAGEVSLFDLIDVPTSIPTEYAPEYKALAAKSTTGVGRRFWQGIESAHWKTLADVLRKDGLAAPIAGSSHWRREKEFADVQGSPGLDLVDDRIYWAAPPWVAPRNRSMLFSLDGGLIPDANRKRRADKPYALGQWCDFTQGVWASPFEAAEQLLAARTASAEDWDALCRRGVFLYPDAWGGSAPGTFGGEDIYQVPAVANAAPHVFALWPHAASILLRGDGGETNGKADHPTRSAARTKRHVVPGWEPERGRLVVNTPFTQGVAGWPGGDSVNLEHLAFEPENTYGVVVASSAGTEPIATTNRLLVTAVARVQPTGFLWVDEWRRETADPGVPPLRQEPVAARVLWKGKKGVKAFALDNDGKRLRPAKIETSDEGTRLVIEGTEPSLHWELMAE